MASQVESSPDSGSADSCYKRNRDLVEMSYRARKALPVSLRELGGPPMSFRDTDILSREQTVGPIWTVDMRDDEADNGPLELTLIGSREVGGEVETINVGTVCNIDVREEVVFLTIEMPLNSCWAIYELSADTFTPQINFDLVHNLDSNAIVHCLFPSNYNYKLRPGLDALDIYAGALRVRHALKILGKVHSKTVIVAEFMQKHGITANMDPDIVFADDISDATLRKRFASLMKATPKKFKLVGARPSSVKIPSPARASVVEDAGEKKKKRKAKRALDLEEENVTVVVEPKKKKSKGSGVQAEILPLATVEPQGQAEFRVPPRPSRGKAKAVQTSSGKKPMNPLDLFQDQESVDELDLGGPEATAEAMHSLLEMEKNYCFGVENVVTLDTQLIFPPLPVMVYRPLNKAHVEELAKAMVKNPGLEPNIADVIPFNPKTGQLLHFARGDLFRFNKMKKDMHYYAISGNHSTMAIRILHRKAETDANLVTVASSLRNRRCRIVSGNTSKLDLANYSLNNNEMNKTMQFVSPFVDTVRHARKQWIHSGRPGKPGAGNKPSAEFKAWEALAKLTMGKKDLKNIFWLILGSDRLFGSWELLVESWLSGKLMDSNGETSAVPREAKLITANQFRCFEGDIEDKDIEWSFEEVKKGAALLYKNALSKCTVPSMEELARTKKVEGKLKQLIVEYYVETFSARFPRDTSWDQVEKQLKFSKAELNRCRQIATDKFLGNFIARNKEKKELPPGLTTRLSNIYHARFGGGLRKRRVPYALFFTENLTNSCDPANLEEGLSSIPLAIVDFSKKNQRLWTDCELEVLFTNAFEMTNNATLVFCFFVFPGMLYANILLATKKLKDFNVHLEFGNYRRKMGHIIPLTFVPDSLDSIIFVGISMEASPDWKGVFLPQHSKMPLIYEFDPAVDNDFTPTAYKTEVPDEETDDEKALRLKYEREKILVGVAPRFSLAGMLGQYTNPDAKPIRILRDIVLRFSRPGETILDFFSGGQLLKCCLLAKRECFIYTDSHQEKEFLLRYPGILREVRKIDEDFKKAERAQDKESRPSKEKLPKPPTPKKPVTPPDQEDDADVGKPQTLEDFNAAGGDLHDAAIGQVAGLEADMNTLMDEFMDTNPSQVARPNEGAIETLPTSSQQLIVFGSEPMEPEEGEMQARQHVGDDVAGPSNPMTAEAGAISPQTYSNLSSRLERFYVRRKGVSDVGSRGPTLKGQLVGYKILSGEKQGKIICVWEMHEEIAKGAREDNFEKVYEFTPVVSEKAIEIQRLLGTQQVDEYGSMTFSSEDDEDAHSTLRK